MYSYTAASQTPPKLTDHACFKAQKRRYALAAVSPRVTTAIAVAVATTTVASTSAPGGVSRPGGTATVASPAGCLSFMCRATCQLRVKPCWQPGPTKQGNGLVSEGQSWLALVGVGWLALGGWRWGTGRTCVRALERLVARVHPDVLGQVRRLRRAVVAARVLTHVLVLAGVDSHMPDQVSAPRGGIAAAFPRALVRLRPGVRPHVLADVPPPGAGVLAICENKWSPIGDCSG